MTRTKIVVVSLAALWLASPVYSKPFARIGLQGGLVALELVGAAPGYGVHFDVGFPAKGFGSIHYYPSVDFWMKSEDKYGYKSHRRMELAANLAELRYFPPVPAQMAVKPYLGMGGTGVMSVLDMQPLYGESSQDVEFFFGVDFFGGCDIVFTDKLRMLVEFRGKSAGITAFKMFAGLALML